MAMVAVGFLAFLFAIAILAPLIAPHNPVQTNIDQAGVFRQAAWISTPDPMTTGRWDYPLGPIPLAETC
jgi:hypothetical protein